MRTGSRRLGRVLVLSVSLILVAMVTMVQARPQTGAAISLDDDDIGGVVTSNRPEAGVWVIAETTDLPTPYRKIVVTDDEGRYLVPDLPDASYQVWVRGYGLVDSPRVQAAPGETLNLTAVVAPDPGAAAEYYPANYWYSLLEPPSEREFTPEGRETSGIAPGISSYQEFLGRIRTTSCGQCHQMGNKVTREMPKNMGTFDSTVAAWSRRVESGQAGAFMSNLVTQLGRSRALEMWADWTDRVMAGELPPVPPRPSGLERNLVITQWDWAAETSYVHDEISTDKRNPTVNAYGPIFGAEQFASETVHVLDPANHVASAIPLPARDTDRMPPQWAQAVLQPSPNWGNELIWTARTDTHNPMMDHKGRTWFTAIIRPPEDQPDWCKEGSDHPSAKVLPREEVDIPVGPGTPWARRGRQLAVYDPATEEFTAVDTCGNGNHLQFAEDENHTLWTGSSWFSVKIWDETGDSSKAAGWLNYVRDANGNGQRDEYVGIDDPMDPTKDKEISGGAYGLITSPVDGALWSSINRFPGELIRVDPGPNPAETALAEVFEPPLVDPADPSKGYQGYTPRGIDIDRHGVVWTGLSGSGHLASFDRRKCTGPLNGPEATGQHCPEGWTLYRSPGPNFKGVTEEGTTDAHYFNWVDQHNTLGLGANVPFLTGSNSDSLIGLVDGEWVVLRVPYPLGFFTKGMDGRIDDPDAGWKGRGMWTTVGAFGSWHIEGGKGQTGKVAHFQMRPDPLAK